MECGDLLELQTAVGMENKDLPVGIRQGSHGLADPAALLRQEHGRFRGGGGIGQGQLLVGGGGIAVLPAALLEPGIFADAAEPGVQAAATLEAVDVQKGLVEGFLQQFLRQVRIAGQREEEPVDRLALGCVEVVKSGHGESSFPMMP